MTPYSGSEHAALNQDVCKHSHKHSKGTQRHSMIVANHGIQIAAPPDQSENKAVTPNLAHCSSDITCCWAKNLLDTGSLGSSSHHGNRVT